MKIFISIKLQCLLIGILIFKISNFNSQNHDLSNSVFSSNIKSIKNLRIQFHLMGLIDFWVI